MKFSKIKLNRYDKNDMLSLLKNFPKNCREGYNFEIPDISEKFDKVVFTGMGGSAISGDIIKVLIDESSEIPVFVIRDYILPAFVNHKSLVIIESYSGNTEETINAYKLTQKKESKILCVSSNGELEKMCKKDNVPFIKIPLGMPPRCALGYLLFPIYKFFVEKKILPALKNTFFEKLENWVNEFLPQNENNMAIKISKKIYDKIPIIYSDNRFYPGILRWKTQIAENSKNFSFINLLPEMNHNEIMAFNYPKWFVKKLIVLFVISGIENNRVKKRIEITKNIISKKVRNILEITLKGDTLFEKILYLIILGDWISYYLAILNKINPTEIKEINLLKEKLKKED